MPNTLKVVLLYQVCDVERFLFQKSVLNFDRCYMLVFKKGLFRQSEIGGRTDVGTAYA
jgi:hypothetical protein